MNFFLNPCRYLCQKQNIRTQLIVIVKSRQVDKKNCQDFAQNSNKSGTVAMKPKQIEVRRKSLFKIVSNPSVKNNKTLQIPVNTRNNQQSNIHRITEDKENQFIQQKVFAKNSSSININSSQEKQDYLQEKVLSIRVQEQTQRKTMKKGSNPLKQAIFQNNDSSLTTKRCRKRNSFQQKRSPVMQPNLQQIQEQVKLKSKHTERQACPNAHDRIPSVRLMNQQIQLLKDELKRLRQDQKSLLAQKLVSQRFFMQDYGMNERKQQKLKENCRQRHQQLNELKQLLLVCKGRII